MGIQQSMRREQLDLIATSRRDDKRLLPVQHLRSPDSVLTKGTRGQSWPECDLLLPSSRPSSVACPQDDRFRSLSLGRSAPRCFVDAPDERTSQLFEGFKAFYFVERVALLAKP